MVNQASALGRHARPTEIFEQNSFPISGNYLAMSLVILAVIYNAILAALAAREINITYSTVASVEVIIIFLCLALNVSLGISKRDIIPIALVWFIGVVSLIVSIKNETLYVNGVRNFLIIAVFSMLGQRMNVNFVRRVFMITTAITLAVLIWEMLSVESYAKFFFPAHYFAVTRGNAISEFDTSGLSAGTIVFDGRFSLGLYSGRRTSSIFLEQVGINAYAIVCMAFLSGLWGDLSIKERSLQIFTIALIIITNNARMAALMCIIMPIGYFIFPRLSKFFILAIPFAIILCIFLLSPILADERGDDLMGRLAVTYRLLNILTASDLFFGNPAFANKSFDSGYAFILTSVGIFGALAYLLYLVVYPSFYNLGQRRAAWSVAIYILLWLIVGGTGSFSIKTAALLWVFIGCLSSTERRPMAEHLRSRQAAPATATCA